MLTKESGVHTYREFGGATTNSQRGLLDKAGFTI